MNDLLQRLRDQLRSRPLATKMISFAGIGVVNALIDLGVFMLAYKVLQLSLVPANVLAWLVAVSCSYVMNSKITFRAESGRTLRRNAYLGFVASGIVGVGATTTTLVVLSHYIPVIAAKLLSMLVSFVVNFAMSHFVVFRRKPTDREAPADL